MKINEKIGRFLHIARKCDIPGLIMSTPGIGKTSTIELYCKTHGINLTTVVGSQYAPDDILGIQSQQDGHLVKLTPSWYNQMQELARNGKPNILFLDELTTCNEFIQAPLLDLIFNKSLGGYKLPENTYVLAAGNYSDCLDGAFQMSKPLINRFLILNLKDKDVDFREIIKKDNFESFKSKSDSEILSYLGLRISRNTDSDKLIKSLISLKPTINTVKNTSNTGLIGFTSIRSITYSIKYLQMAETEHYLDESAVDVIVDTLGCTSERAKFYSLIRSTGYGFISSKDLQSMTDEQVNEFMKEMIDSPDKITENVYKVLKDRISGQQGTGSINSELFDKLSKLILGAY